MEWAIPTIASPMRSSTTPSRSSPGQDSTAQHITGIARNEDTFSIQLLDTPFCPKSESQSTSCRFTVVVTQHSAESLAPFNQCMRPDYGAARIQQAVF